MQYTALCLTCLLFFLVCANSGVFGAVISGENKQFHRLTFLFTGPESDEGDDINPFLFYRLNVEFSHASLGTFTIPGHFAADGNAAETSATSGDQWRVYFNPIAAGTWTWKASFRSGDMISISLDPSSGTPHAMIDGESGMINIDPSDKISPDFRAEGLLIYAADRYLRHVGTGRFFLKGGADSPENLLAFADFDQTFNNGGTDYIKTYGNHTQDFVEGEDPVWKTDKGKGLIGAINYLAGKGMNAMSFLTFNVPNGDGKDVWPWTTPAVTDRFDVSKLDQWEIVFSHAQKKGVNLHFKTQEQEVDQYLDGGDLGPNRKLYYRELISRFSHHNALNWNLGEESTQTAQQNIDAASWVAALDAYHHLIVLHTYPGSKDSVYTPLLGSLSNLTGISMQTGNPANVYSEVTTWLENSDNAGKIWVCASDEIGPANIGVSTDDDYSGDQGTASYNQPNIRKTTIWGALCAGSQGVEMYFGYQTGETDLTCQDWRSRDRFWEWIRYALDFFWSIPFWEMHSNECDLSVGDGYCLGTVTDDFFIVYLKSASLGGELSGVLDGEYNVTWYNPRDGVYSEPTVLVAANATLILNAPPDSPTEDWAVKIVHTDFDESTAQPGPIDFCQFESCDFAGLSSSSAILSSSSSSVEGDGGDAGTSPASRLLPTFIF